MSVTYFVYFFIFIYILSFLAGSVTPKEEEKVVEASVCHNCREHEQGSKQESEEDVKAYKKKLIQNEIQRLNEEYENLDFEMTPRKLREWIRKEIKDASS